MDWYPFLFSIIKHYCLGASWIPPALCKTNNKKQHDTLQPMTTTELLLTWDMHLHCVAGLNMFGSCQSSPTLKTVYRSCTYSSSVWSSWSYYACISCIFKYVDNNNWICKQTFCRHIQLMFGNNLLNAQVQIITSYLYLEV